jgi:tetrahydromethanopterin S-methyltransferase subunit F
MKMTIQTAVRGTYLPRAISLAAGVLMALILIITPAIAAAAAPQPDFYMVTATANYRPVDRPGTQRRVAQNDAEEKARMEIYEYVGNMRSRDGRTINDLLARDARLKARVLEIIRNSETYEWGVAPGCACVQVWVRLDLNFVRAALAQCGY